MVDILRARPNLEEEQEGDFQEEEYLGDEEYYENDELFQEGTENNLRARPVFVPGMKNVLP